MLSWLLVQGLNCEGIMSAHLSNHLLPFFVRKGKNPEGQKCLITSLKTRVKAHQVMSLLVFCRNIVLAYLCKIYDPAETI